MKIRLAHFFLGKLTFSYALGKTEYKSVTPICMPPINVMFTSIYMLSTNIILILHASNYFLITNMVWLIGLEQLKLEQPIDAVDTN